MNENNFGKYIQQYRKQNGMSQKELGRRLNVSEGCVSSWEVGRTEPNMGNIIEMSNIFGCTLAELTGYKNDTPKNHLITYAEKLTGLTSDEERLVKIYNSLSEDKQHELLKLAIDLMMK